MLCRLLSCCSAADPSWTHKRLETHHAIDAEDVLLGALAFRLPCLDCLICVSSLSWIARSSPCAWTAWSACVTFSASWQIVCPRSASSSWPHSSAAPVAVVRLLWTAHYFSTCPSSDTLHFPCAASFFDFGRSYCPLPHRVSCLTTVIFTGFHLRPHLLLELHFSPASCALPAWWRASTLVFSSTFIQPITILRCHLVARFLADSLYWSQVSTVCRSF